MFSDKAHFDLGGYVEKQNYRTVRQARKTRTRTLKIRCTQNESLFGVGFGPDA